MKMKFLLGLGDLLLMLLKKLKIRYQTFSYLVKKQIIMQKY